MAESIADVVNTWFRERLASGAIARNTEAYNQAADALPDLIARLSPPATQAETPPETPPGTPPAISAAKPVTAKAAADPVA